MRTVNPRWMTALLVKVPGLAWLFAYFQMPDGMVAGLVHIVVAVTAFVAIGRTVLDRERIRSWPAHVARRRLGRAGLVGVFTCFALFVAYTAVVGQHTYGAEAPADGERTVRRQPVLVPVVVTASPPGYAYRWLDCRLAVTRDRCDTTAWREAGSIGEVADLVSQYGDGIVLDATWWWHAWAVALAALFGGTVASLVSLYGIALVRGATPERLLHAET